MRCLEIRAGKAYFLHADGSMKEIDRITKDDILYLLDIASSPDNSFEMDNYEGSTLNNEAHLIIYKNLFSKFSDFLEEKDRFLDEAESLYQDAIEKYQV